MFEFFPSLQGLAILMRYSQKNKKSISVSFALQKKNYKILRGLREIEVI